MDQLMVGGCVHAWVGGGCVDGPTDGWTDDLCHISLLQKFYFLKPCKLTFFI